MLNEFAEAFDDEKEITTNKGKTTERQDFLNLIKSKGLIGKPMSEFLKQYYHAQKSVGRPRASDLMPDLPKPGTEKKPEDSIAPPPQSQQQRQIFPTNADDKQVTEIKQNLIL